MSKQSIQIVIIAIVSIIMIGFLKNIFTPTVDSKLEKAIKEGAFLVDVRSPSEFASGSVKGAVNIPVNQVSSQLSKFKNKKNIVVFCRSGARSSQAKSILEQNGFGNVIDGGSYISLMKVMKIK